MVTVSEERLMQTRCFSNRLLVLVYNIQQIVKTQPTCYYPVRLMNKKKETKNKITSDWTISKVIEKYPDASAIFSKHGFPCVGCAMAQFETIEEGTLVVHGKDKKFLKTLLKELNKLVR